MENANNLIENSQIAKPSDALSSMPPISAEDLSLWNERLSTLGITLLPSVLKPLEAYGNLLIAGNLRMNLTRLTSPHEFWFRHVLDALLLLPYLPKSGRLMDVGSGAGVPLFPLMLATDDKKLEFHAIESTQKKAVFLQEAADALGLQLALHAERAETCGRLPALRESFDVVTARALAAMPVLLELTTPLLKPGGEALFLKGPGVFEELDHARYALHELCCRVIETKAITLPLVGTQTVVVRVKKLANTPKIYPRKPGIPGKKPLS